MKKLICSIMILFLIIGCQSQDSTKHLANKNLDSIVLENENIDTTLAGLVYRNPIVGIAASVISEDSVIYRNAFGSDSFLPDSKYSPETIQPLASVSKTFIGLSIMILVDQGKLSLDEKINDILPYKITNPYHPDKAITIRHLVTHTSTITDDYDDIDDSILWLLEEYKAEDYNSSPNVKDRLSYFSLGKPIGFDQYISNVCLAEGKWFTKDNFLNHEPGTRYEYSNIGATIAARVVELKSGQAFMDFTENQIFKKLNMHNTSWEYGNLDNNLISNLYELDSLNNPIRIPRYHEAGYPEGQLKSNAVDMSNYVQEMLRGLSGKGKILTNTSYKTLFTPQLSETHFEERSDFEFDDEYNVGVFWSTSKAGLILHNGAMDGVYSFLYLNPINKIGVIAFSNTTDNSFGAVRTELRTFEKQIMPAAYKR